MLDKWRNKDDANITKPKSVLSSETITRYSLKERILELEKMRDQILYELDRLQEITQNRKL